jgi:hypothetical protein
MTAPRVRFAISLVAVALVAATLAACKPKAGANCKIELKVACANDKQALACHDGKWEEMPCKGPTGCSKNGNDTVCDQSIADENDVCNIVDDHLCSADKKAMLECGKARRWLTVQSCLGARGCVLEAKKVTCDNSIANAGDACSEEDDYACTPDGSAALVCRGGKFGVASNCKGPKHCQVSGDKASGFKVECDDSIAAVGEPCDKEGHYACAPDEKSIVRCKEKKFAPDDKCRRGEKCQVRGDQVGCY